MKENKKIGLRAKKIPITQEEIKRVAKKIAYNLKKEKITGNEREFINQTAEEQ